MKQRESTPPAARAGCRPGQPRVPGSLGSLMGTAGLLSIWTQVARTARAEAHAGGRASLSLCELHLWLWATCGESNSGEGCISTNNGRMNILDSGDCWSDSGHAPCIRDRAINVDVMLWYRWSAGVNRRKSVLAALRTLGFWLSQAGVPSSPQYLVPPFTTAAVQQVSKSYHNQKIQNNPMMIFARAHAQS